MKKLGIAILIIVFTIMIGGSYLLWDLKQFAISPTQDAKTEKIITIRSGQGLASITDALYQAGLINSKRKLRWLIRIRGDDKNLQAGEYALMTDMSPEQILDALVTGRVLQHRFTIPEGYTMDQIGDVVARSGLAEKADFMDACKDPDFAKVKGIEADTFEGYLFPDTYQFPRHVDADSIATAMVNRFWSVFTEEWRQRAADMGMTVHQVVTLASVIEKETGAPDERPLISSVFHNRLKRGMRLESDPTVIYGVKDFDGNLTREHLNAATPYNTYKIKGLPPGPIASPGAAALEAALYPADTEYIFFVSKQDGTHEFSKSLKDHNAAVRKYQLGNADG